MCFNSLSFGRNISFCCTGLGYHSARQVGPGSMVNRAEKRNRETASEEANYIMPEKHLRRSLVGWSLQGLIFSSFFSDILRKTYLKIQSFLVDNCKRTSEFCVFCFQLFQKQPPQPVF